MNKVAAWCIFCGWIGWLTVLVAEAQPLELVKEVKTGRPVCVSLDRNSRIFISDEKGNINQYDANGNFLLNYSPPKVGRISLLEAWKTVQVFAFYRDLQQYTLLDRFLNSLSQNRVDEDKLGFVRVATMAADDNLWVFDEVDFSLKKYGLRNQTILLNAPLNLVLDARDYDINFMREYQNSLFINDRNSGILVFDNLGNYRKKLPFEGLTSFGLFHDELYFLVSDQVHFFHLYNLTERIIALPAGRKPLQVLVLEDRLVLFEESGMAIYRFQ